MKDKKKQFSGKLGENLLFFVPFLLLVIIWEAAIAFSLLDPILFPPPSQILAAFFNLISKRAPNLIDHIIRSLFHIFMGYSFGVGFGVLFGTLMGVSNKIHTALYPIFSLLIPVPTVAWVPLLLIILGINDITIITAIFLGCFFPVTYSTISGIRSVDKQLIWAAETMGAGKLDVYFEVIVPSSLVSMIAGLRLAVGYSWRALVGAEALASIPVGIGYLIFSSQWSLNIAVLFTGLILIGLGGLTMDRVLFHPLELLTIEKWGLVDKQGE